MAQLLGEAAEPATDFEEDPPSRLALVKFWGTQRAIAAEPTAGRVS